MDKKEVEVKSSKWSYLVVENDTRRKQDVDK